MAEATGSLSAEQIVLRILQEEIDPALSLDSPLTDLESLDLIDALMRIEEVLHARVPDEQLKNLKVIRDILAYLPA